MPTLLHVSASPRGDHSISRGLGSLFVRSWRDARPNGVIIERDLAAPTVPYMDLNWIAGVYAPATIERTPEMSRAVDFSAELIDEVKRADHILLDLPMYNFTIPANLKSWIDYIVRPGFTFAPAPGWPGLLDDKPIRVLVACRDTYDPGGDDDQVTPVLKRVFAFMGLRDLKSLLAGGSLGVNRGDVRLQDHLARFEQPIAQMVEDLGETLRQGGKPQG